jgi:hypothetical protein
MILATVAARAVGVLSSEMALPTMSSQSFKAQPKASMEDSFTSF